MKKIQSCSPLSRMKTATYPYGYSYVRSYRGLFDINDFFEGPVVDRIKHVDFDTTKGNTITQIFMYEDYSTCPCCGASKLIGREFILFYTKDSIIEKIRESRPKSWKL